MSSLRTQVATLALAVSTALWITPVCAADAEQTTKNTEEKAKQAEEAKEEDVERIAVYGIRSSIKESMFLKQNATSVVDLVVADDIGKFPDENLAEALQRIPGITITRNGGEGQNILVRGLGAGYNVTTLNGRKLASEYAGRDFNFDTIASELVNVLAVYKSPEARLTEGGIGAIVDIQTRKPLDLDGFTLQASAKGIHESRTGDIHPHASFIIGDQNDDGSLGALFSAVYSKKTLRADTYSADGFFDEDEGWGVDSAGVPVDANNNGTIDEGEIFASKIPSYMYFANAQDVRERIGSTLALQWRPSDDLTLSLDGLFSRYNTDGNRYQIGFVNYDESWTPGTPLFTDAQFDDLGRVVKMKQTGDNTMVELLNISTPRQTDTWQLGLNAEWHPTDQWSVYADAAYSQAENKNKGDNRFIVARGFVDSIGIDYSTGNTLPDVVISPALTSDQTYGAHYSYNSGTGVKDKVNDFKLEAIYEPEDSLVSKVHFGVNYVKQSKTQNAFGSRNPSQFSRGGFYLTRDGYDFAPGQVFTQGEFELFRIPENVFVPANFDNFLDGENSVSPDPWPSFDYDALLAFYRSINAEAADASIVATQSKSGSYEVSEAVTSAFVQVTLEDELWELPYMLNLGLRASHTQVDSSGFGYDLSKVVLDSAGNPTNNDWRAVLPVGHEGSYSNVLPSLNFRLNLQDDLLLRVSAAQTLSRPSLYALRTWANPDFVNRKEGLPTLSRGNPGVSAEEAYQGDVTLEWYYGDSSSLAAGVFVKDIQSFIENDENAMDVEGNRYMVNQPESGEYGALITGYEVAWQQSLEQWLPSPLDGFGVQLNYTYVDSEYDDPARKEQNLPFAGMSENSYNAVLYYEKYGLQGRFAYNWRSKFLVDPEAWGGPAWINAYGQLDASLSYALLENLNVFVEASNLGNDRYSGYIKRPDQVNYLERFGTQIAFGVRGSF
ncbi:TonB-dependent receptor [Shewanella amazonensis]|uniref:TonB-dependent receptor n=1 Tax=Shewanella amazonensis (strain ATCC BAA-1098 / SB2B) TaxID=326297 RepID=A1S4U3_SHEAM|nr:TonB-dependent receptor [Shewanella amazonensis]ABL99399.1 TonB-dependent receptor [Shewanella amazonensis SB2B]